MTKEKTNPDPVTLTFSKKNTDVAKILDEISKDGTKKTDYICRAVKYYYDNFTQQHQEINDNKNIENILEKMIDKKLNDLLENKGISINKDDLNVSSFTSTDLSDD